MSFTAWACALGAIFLWAIFATLVGQIGPMPPLFLTGAALCLGSLATIHRWREWRVPFSTLAFGAGSLFVYHVCLISAFTLAPIAEANLVNYLWPLFLVLLAPWVAQAGRLRRAQLIGAGIAFAGCAVAIAPSGMPWAFAARHGLGYALALVAAITWALYSLVGRRLAPYSPWAVGGFCLVAGLMSLGAHLVFEPAVVVPAPDWAWIAALGLGPLGLAFVLWDVALRRGQAAKIGTIAYSTPVLSTVSLAWSGAADPDSWGRLAVALALVMVGVRVGR